MTAAGPLLPGSPADRRGTEFRRGPAKPPRASSPPIAAAWGPANTSVPLCSAAAAPAGRLAIAAEVRDIARPGFVPPESPASAFSMALGSVPRPETAADDDRIGPDCVPEVDAGPERPLTAPFEFDRVGSPFRLRPTEVLAGPAIIPSPFFVPLRPAKATPTSLAVAPTASARRPSPRPVIPGCPFVFPIAG